MLIQQVAIALMLAVGLSWIVEFIYPAQTSGVILFLLKRGGRTFDGSSVPRPSSGVRLARMSAVALPLTVGLFYSMNQELWAVFFSMALLVGYAAFSTALEFKRLRKIVR